VGAPLGCQVDEMNKLATMRLKTQTASQPSEKEPLRQRELVYTDERVETGLNLGRRIWLVPGMHNSVLLFSCAAETPTRPFVASSVK